MSQNIYSMFFLYQNVNKKANERHIQRGSVKEYMKVVRKVKDCDIVDELKVFKKVEMME